MFFIDLDNDYIKRYDFGKFVEFENNVHKILDSFLVLKFNDLSPFGRFIVRDEEYKPELISHKIYGDTQYWWLLMNYNNIIEIDNLINGLTINYPSINDIEDLYFSLKSLEEASG